METTANIVCHACGQSVRHALPGPRAGSPGRFKVEQTSEGLRIHWRWFQPGRDVAMLAFCIAWDAFLLFWYGAALHSERTPWIMVVFPIAHVAVGVGLTYGVLAALLNRTELTVGRGWLRVQHGPLPWTKAPELRTRQVRQLFSEERISRGEDSDTARYDLCAIDSDGRKVVLVRDLPTPEQALFLEQELEGYLGVPERP